ncbi:lipopolysaccharide assembly protein LapA domain-containing protein [Abiotrophia defectiva]|uniref:lipopolysaccharide assembly protein LapA domain-containing protein n=1 Tax=Abiotrophia defectiva TaxID=46125 RepID=UPI0028D875DE|nr:lipopolysaccharide assembly protein LapA domain-containing protein [Abiotrophia defectiva]
MRQQWKLILGVCAVILVVIFALQNVNNVQVTFLFFQAQMPMVLVLLISILFGLLIGFLSSLSSHMANRAAIKNLNKEREALSKEQSSFETTKAELEAQYQANLEEKNQEIAGLQETLADLKAQVEGDSQSQAQEEETSDLEADLDQSAQELEDSVDEFEESLQDDEDPQVSRG